MKIKNLKKYKIISLIFFTIIIICSFSYYFGYYKDSPEHAANVFFRKIKNSVPGHRNVEEIYNRTYYEKATSDTSNFIGFEEMMKSYYQYLILDKYKLKSKTKIDEELYEFSIFIKPGMTDINRKENNIANFFMIKINGEWKLAWEYISFQITNCNNMSICIRDS